jgi:acetyltransferase-like isoleucine patch superfamily enzyme
MGLWILLNYFPFLFAAGLVVVSLIYSWWLAIAILYLLPPLLARIAIGCWGLPSKNEPVPSRKSYVWWFTTQLQVPFMRFPFLEEIIRMVPALYSTWLRLWGAKVGRNVYWSAQVLVADRPFIDVGDFVVFGYGSKLTSHLLTKVNSEMKLIFGAPIIKSKAILGTLSCVGPGAYIGEGQILKATAVISPFDRFENKQKFNSKNKVSATNLIMTHEEA